MTEKNPIISIPVREKGGSIASAGFSYQVNWGICELLDLYKTKDDFALIMELHDDVIVCDNINSPKNIFFYQIKLKRTGNWSIQNLTKSKKGDSIVAKMYSSRHNFRDIAKKISFRTDARFSFDNAIGIKKNGDFFILEDISKSEKEKIVNAIELKYPGFDRINLPDIIEFKTEKIKSDNFETTTKGILSDFFDVELGTPYRSSAYHFIGGELYRRQNNSSKIRNLSDLKKRKTVDKDTFSKWLNHCVSNLKLVDERIKEIKDELKSKNGLGFSERKKIIADVETYRLKLKSSDRLSLKLQEELKKFKLKRELPAGELYECALKIRYVMEGPLKFAEHLGKNYILAVIMYEII